MKHDSDSYKRATNYKEEPLVNLLEATCDILVTAGVLADDNSKIVAAHDGSRVLYDKESPRVEITIERMDVDALQSNVSPV